jgi:polyhydroxybutyrate depolymerase
MKRVTRRVVVFATAAIVAIGLAACTPSVAATLPHGVQSISVNATERTFTLAGSVAQGAPLLIVLHGAGLNGRGAEGYTGMTPLAKANGFLVAYPNGSLAADIPDELSWNSGECCGAPARDGVNDVAFIRALIDDLESTYPIDPDRVYLAGFSNGGMLSYQLACDSPTKLAGIAVVGGAFNVDRCSATAPMRVLIIHGKKDTTVPYNGGETSARVAGRFGTFGNASVDDAIAYWSERNGCLGEPTIVDDDVIDESRWTECSSGASLLLDAIDSGTHLWPTDDNEGFNASERIVEYFGLGAAASATPMP